MKKFIAYAFLILALSIFIFSSVDDLTRIPAQAKYATDGLLGSDKYKYGDLYGMSYLPQFKTLVNHKQPNKACCDTTGGYHIYAISDSYTWDVFKDPANLCGASVSGFAASNFRDVLPVYPDKRTRNIVVIESNERNIRALLTDTAYLMRAIHVVKPGEDTSKLETRSRRRGEFHFDFRLKETEANFEFNTWDYRLFTPLKELKAWATYKWFGRHEPDVTVAPDGKRLLYTPTIDTTTNQAAFTPVNNAEIDKLVKSLNRVAEHYRAQGFSDVYLALIPHPVTILYPDFNGMKYNRLIPRIQARTDLKLKVFDSYSLFSNYPDKDKLYLTSDTHWTYTGMQLWVDALNKELTDPRSPGK